MASSWGLYIYMVSVLFGQLNLALWRSTSDQLFWQNFFAPLQTLQVQIQPHVTCYVQALYLSDSVFLDILLRLHYYLWTIPYKSHIPPVILSIHHTHYTILLFFFFQHSMYLITHHRPFLFSPEAQTGRYSCHNTHTAFTDTTDITARGMFCVGSNSQSFTPYTDEVPSEGAEA